MKDFQFVSIVDSCRSNFFAAITYSAPVGVFIFYSTIIFLKAALCKLKERNYEKDYFLQL